MATPSAGPYAISLAQPAFYLLVGLLAAFVLMYLFLRRRHPRGRRAIEGFLEAARVDLGFLIFAVAAVVALVWADPHGSRSAFAAYEVILGGYWLAFSIPIVTVGSSVHHRTRGGVAWKWPAIALSIALFGLAFAYYYSVA